MPLPLAEKNSEDAFVEAEPPSAGAATTRRRGVLLGLTLLGAIGVALVTFWLLRSRKPVSTARTVQSASDIKNTAPNLRLKGTTQAVETRAILAPLLSGAQEGTLTITRLMPVGSRVKLGDLLVEFDSQAQLHDFIDKQTESDKLSGDLMQGHAKEDAARAKDETEIQTAEDSLGTAELEMQKVELMSKIDAEKARESLDEAKATVQQLKETFDLKRKAAQASIRILEIQRDRARDAMLHAQANAALMQVHSPIDGIVVLNTIWKEGSMGEVQEGDQVRPGVPFMQVVDPSRMEVQVSVNQQDVLALQAQQQARIHLDAYPDLVCPGKLEVVDPLGQPGPFSPKVRVFSALFSVKCVDPRLLPGLSAAVDLVQPLDNRAAGNLR
ncbi:multidrug resistance efflux pump [Granulicella aggregans]|uniref:Multidrug resistance efflux pump n=1 Tax=Granulicella aggregans TaxID=474949 RepID=A0A7W8E8D1_9BACT|nr:multidrug resistance efflux pump [Granulicella aggregans]